MHIHNHTQYVKSLTDSHTYAHTHPNKGHIHTCVHTNLTHTLTHTHTHIHTSAIRSRTSAHTYTRTHTSIPGEHVERPYHDDSTQDSGVPGSETPPNFKGNTALWIMKPATLTRCCGAGACVYRESKARLRLCPRTMPHVSRGGSSFAGRKTGN
jgi:hypothetical protein